MKKFFVVCGLALALSAVSHQRASAWHKFGFSIGMNICWEAANNSYFCGRIVSGPAPYGYAPYFDGFNATAFPGGYGSDGHYAAAPAAQVAPQAVAQSYARPAAQTPVQQAHYSWGQTGYYGQNYYQATSYGYGYGSSVPSYWYGY
jgi:hypothetical protein